MKVLINVAKPAQLPALSSGFPVRPCEDDGGKNIKDETNTPSQSAQNRVASLQQKSLSSAVESKTNANLPSQLSSETDKVAEPSSKPITGGKQELKSRVLSSNRLPVEPKNVRSEVANKLEIQTPACDQSSSKTSKDNTDKSGLVIRKRKKAKVIKQEVSFPL